MRAETSSDRKEQDTIGTGIVCGSVPRPMTTAEIRRVVGIASRAPSVHNSQPWLFDWDGCRLDLRADWTRHLPVLDPSGRQLMMSCGAALGLVVVALRATGRDPRVRLSDDPGDAGPLASLDTAASLAPAGVERARELLGAVRARRTVRGGFTDLEAPDGQRYSLMGTVASLGARATPVLDPARRREVIALIAAADAAQRSRPDYRAELHAWLREPGDCRGDGVPRDQKETPARALPNRYGCSPSIRPGRAAAAPSTLVHARPPGRTASLAGAPDLVVLSTPADGPRDRVVAGQALVMLMLVATRLGLGVMPVNQPVEEDGARRDLARTAGVSEYPQALLAVGHPRGRAASSSPRRVINSFFTNRSSPGGA
jgi:nitroreductase